MTKVICKQCGEEFEKRRYNQIFCTRVCTMSYHQGLAYGKSVDNKLSSGVTGAISELFVSADLMYRGYEVYRAVSPASSCDLVALKNGVSHTIEVRTGFRSNDGTVQYPRKHILARYLAVFIRKDKSISYFPQL